WSLLSILPMAWPPPAERPFVRGRRPHLEHDRRGLCYLARCFGEIAKNVAIPQRKFGRQARYLHAGRQAVRRAVGHRAWPLVVGAARHPSGGAAIGGVLTWDRPIGNLTPDP